MRFVVFNWSGFYYFYSL